MKSTCYWILAAVFVTVFVAGGVIGYLIAPVLPITQTVHVSEYHDQYVDARLREQVLQVSIESCLADDVCQAEIVRTWQGHGMAMGRTPTHPGQTYVHGPFVFGPFKLMRDTFNYEPRLDYYIDYDHPLIKEFCASYKPGLEEQPMTLHLARLIQYHHIR